MALFDWLKAKPVHPQTSILPADDLTVPSAHSTPEVHAAASRLDDLKMQRQLRREHLYAVVRDVMLRSEVLAARYKFKVLSLDVRGSQFLIMVDLLSAHDLSSDRFMDIERLIAATAAAQHDLQVKAVYWRVNQVEAAAVTPAASPKVHHHSAAAQALPQTPTLRATAKPAADPISPEEILAFQQAVSAGTQRQPIASTPEPRTAAVPTGLTGYEDTQLLEPEDSASPLSKTQFGGL